MTNTPLTPIDTRTSRISTGLPLPVKDTRQGKHGGTAWSVPFSEKNLRQPQDGSAQKRKRLAMIGSQLHTNLLNEPEDAGLTGGTRSLTRRLLGLNVTTKRRVVSQTVTAITRVDVA